MNAPTWISEALARTIHDDQIARYGGSLGIRDESLFLASLDRSRNLFAYGDNPNLFDLAAAYAFGIAKNHPFIDGNKRTAFVLAAVFLEINGFTLDAPEPEVVLTMTRLASNLETQDSLARWLEMRSQKIDTL
jgi:death on curing protein